jgi:hypothetical protein
MTIQEILFVDILGFGFIFFVINLVRNHKLLVGYAIIWLLSVMGLMLTVSVPFLLSIVEKVVELIFPVSSFVVFAFIFIFLMLLIFSLKLSALSNRQAELVQMIALKETDKQESIVEENCKKESDFELKSKVNRKI